MYITENQNIGESVLFLLSARSTLAEMVEDSNHKNADVMINFLMNEASDYEIISLLTVGALPDKKYDQVAEAYLFSVLKEQVLRQSQAITEMIGQASFNDFLNKVDSVYPVMSTTVPMLEFFAPQDPQILGAAILAEQGGAKEFYKALAKKQASHPGPAPTWKGNYGPHGASSAKAIAQNKMTAGDIARQRAGEGPLGTMNRGTTGDSIPLKSRLSNASSDLQAWGNKTLADIKAGVHSVADVVSNFAKSTPGHVVGGAALAALLAYAAAKTYKRFFSKAAGACRGMSGGAKTDCMNKFRGRALMAQAADLQKGMASCAKAKNPAACKSAVGGKIERLKARAAKVAG
jgi:hypothetical protein